MQAFLVKLIIGALEKIGVIVANLVTQYLAERALRKKVKEKIKEIKGEKDPTERSRRMRDAINSI